MSQENNSYSLHFSAKYLEDKGYVASTIYVVANYGSSMQIKGPHNVGELQRIKEETSSLSGIISGNSMLFAKAIENETHTDADGTGERRMDQAPDLSRNTTQSRIHPYRTG